MENKNTYQTGDVRQPKSHRGIIALLLMAVIFLGSLVSGLGLMNIRLLQQLQQQEETIAPVRLVDGEQEQQIPGNYNEKTFSRLGVSGFVLTGFDRNFYNLPQGIYITKVEKDALGICPGDILLEVNDTPITDTATLEKLLADASDSLGLTFYRNGAQHKKTVPLP